MWTVKLPEEGDLNAQLDAALIYKNGEFVYELSAAERAAIHDLYGAYHQLQGEPDPTLKPAALVGCADALHGAYGQVQKGQRLASLREALLAAVLECPLCGSAPATTLDHHLPRDDYRALSINPRNLVPSCQPCNRAKGTLVPVAGQGMIHAYYQVLPQATFFRADVTYVGGSLVVTFGIDAGDLSPGLAARLRFQLDRMKLNERHPDAVNLFLFAIKPSLEWFRGKPGERDLIRDWLVHAANTYDVDLGLNHWRTAVLRGLAMCASFLDDPWSYLDKPPAAMQAA